jgi:hypothetical protein
MVSMLSTVESPPESVGLTFFESSTWLGLAASVMRPSATTQRWAAMVWHHSVGYRFMGLTARMSAPGRQAGGAVAVTHMRTKRTIHR